MATQRIMKESGLTGNALAADSGLSVDTITAWNTGRRSPSPKAMRKLASGLRARADKLKALARQLETRARED